MTQYLTKMTLTNKAWAALSEKPQDRFEAVRPLYEAAGGKLLDYWFAVDQGAIYLHSEGPEDQSNILAMEIAVFGSEVISSFEGTRILNAADAMESMKKVKSLSYRPIASSSTTTKK